MIIQILCALSVSLLSWLSKYRLQTDKRLLFWHWGQNISNIICSRQLFCKAAATLQTTLKAQGKETCRGGRKEWGSVLDFLTKATAKLSWPYIRHTKSSCSLHRFKISILIIVQMNVVPVQYIPVGCASTWLSPCLSTSHMALVQKCTDMTGWCLGKSSPRQKRAG